MRTKLLIIFFIAICSINNEMVAQVGIGTITPDPSSILDMNSTTQGMLAPRMTSAQRIGIASPAEGLLVFDNEQDAFYYFKGGSWEKLEGAVKRDNYKLVKSTADLADELAAGGGTSYKLNSAFLYEINGTIIVDHPIELNEAYVKGQDTRGDMLFNLTGAALFTGFKGGNIRDLLVNGNGKPAFDISASSTQNLIFNSVVFVNCNAVGSLNDLGLVFFNISQFINCTGGITVNNVTSYLMSNIFWRDNSTDTFLSFTGTFDDIQLSSGRIAVDNGEIGIDVSSNPTVNNTASINGVAFTGNGTRINGYTTGGYPGYLFTKNWDVSTPGLKSETDNDSTGDIFLSTRIGSGFVTTFNGTGTSSRTKIIGLSASNNLYRFIRSGDNRIVYDGVKPRNFQITTSLSFQGDNNNAIFIFYIAKGNSGDTTATVLEDSRVYREVGSSNDVGAVAILGNVDLNPGDFIEIWAERYSGGGDLLTVSLNLVAK